MDIQTLVQVAQDAQTLRPIAQAAIDEFKEFYLPLLEQASEYALDKGAESRIKAFKRFRNELSVSSDQAVALTIDLHNMFKNTKGAK